MKILLVDDHAIVRRGVISLLQELFKDVEFGESGDARQGYDAAVGGDWDLVLMDIRMSGRSGLDFIQDVRRAKPALKMLVFSAYEEKDYAMRALKLGAAGYVSKQGAAETLVTAVERVLSGGRYVSPALAEHMADSGSGGSGEASHESLSNRELEVLKLIALGKTLKEIGLELALSEKTIATYRGRIAEKMGLSSNVDLTRYAMRHGLVD